MEELRSIFTVVAVLVSFWSGYSVRRLWYQANRPIVSAVIKTNTSGVGYSLFDLVVINSGNRPATNIFLSASQSDIDKILLENIGESYREEMYQIFSKKYSRIQLLVNGDKATTALFAFATNPTQSVEILKYEAELPIVINYQDLDGKKYTSNLSLYVRDANGFGGSMWEKSKS